MVRPARHPGRSAAGAGRRGRAGAARRAAEQALRLVAAAEGADTLLAAAGERYGAEAADILAEALAADPLENALPARMPVLPAWARPGYCRSCC
ncbi:hypothetical protein ACFQZC_24770 [Streptacidiphilus monticola]